jgi:hypothetical protein
MSPRIGILVVAYNAESTLRSVIARIPREIMDKVEEIFVFDDASQDATHDVGREIQREHHDGKLSIYRNETNLMYGRRGWTSSCSCTGTGSTRRKSCSACSRRSSRGAPTWSWAAG